MLFSDSNSKKRKTFDGFGYDGAATLDNLDGYGNMGLDLDSPGGEWAALKERTKKRIESLASMGGDPQRFGKSFSNYMLPQDTPERRRRVYATSPQALDDVVGDYYSNELKPRFEANREESRNKARGEYMKYAGTVGGDPVNAFHQAMRTDNPLGVIDKTMDEIDHSRLVKDVAPLASYGGFDTEDYVNKFVKPSLHDKMVDEYIEENKPKSSGEYIMRSALGNSVLGKVATLGNNALAGNSTHSQLEREGLLRYDAGRVENFAAGVGSLLVDTPVFGALGSVGGAAVGKATSLATNRLAARFIARNAGKGISREYARNVASRAIKENLSSKIMQSAAGQGLTLGNYDLANSVVDDMLYNSGVDWGKAAGSFAKGLATGGAVGAVGTPLKAASKGLTGGKKLFASAGVLSAESAVFTLGGEAEKIAHGVDIEPIDLLYDFGESAATLLTMRMAHWRPKGAEFKLDRNGRIKEGLRFTGAEKQELRERNVDADGLMSAIEQELGMPSLGGRNAETVKESYSKLMSDRNLSAALRSKLLVLVENKITSTPPLTFDYTVKRGNDGSFAVTMLDANGRIVEKKSFQGVDDAKEFIASERGNIRRNRINYYERELTNGMYTQNFLRQGGEYVREKGIDANVLAEAMLKKAENAELTAGEQKVIDDVMARSSYDNTGIITYLYDRRRDIERNYGIEEGELLYLVDLPAWKCSAKENRALDDYEKVVRDEVSRLKGGVDDSRYGEIFDHGMAGGYDNFDNHTLRERERLDYAFGKMLKRRKGNLSYGDMGGYTQPERPVTIPETGNPDIVWSGRGVMKSRQEVEGYKAHAEKLASKLNLDVKLITDEREIEPAGGNDVGRVAEYNRRVGSLGWVNDGKVYLNLPNMESVAELEKTAVHEIVAHAGLKKIFGNHMNDFLEEVYRKGGRDVLEGIRDVKRRNNGADSYEVVEEYLAELAERGYHTPQERGVISRFKDFIKNMLVRKNIYTGENRKISEKELEELMHKHSRHVLGNGRLDGSYRRRMFGGFETAGYDDARYTDKALYDDYVRNSYADGSFMERTPRFMLNDKVLHNYSLLPERFKARIREKSGLDDASIESSVSGDRYRFIGKKGAGNLAMYNYEDSGLEKAMEYESQGMGAAAIKFKTGWERGADGQWRKELSDNSLNVKDCIGQRLLETDHNLFADYYELTEKPRVIWNQNDIRRWNTLMSQGKKYLKDLKLADLVSDPTFFISYPELKELPVKVVAGAKELARYDSNGKQVVIDRDLYLSENKDVEMAGVLQNLIQDYEGFSRAMSLRQLAAETAAAKEYEKIVGGIEIAYGVAKDIPGYDRNMVIGDYLKKNYGMTPEEFNRYFPTLDDFLMYKLDGPTFRQGSDIETENVKARFGMTPFERSIILAEETEGYPRYEQMSTARLDKMRRMFSGPLDIVNGKLKLVRPELPLDIYMNSKDRKAYMGIDLSKFRKVKDWNELFGKEDDFGWHRYKSILDNKNRERFIRRRGRKPGDDEEEMMVVN